MTYVIDGMPISDQLTGAFANAMDTSIVQTIELYTGNIPAGVREQGVGRGEHHDALGARGPGGGFPAARR